MPPVIWGFDLGEMSWGAFNSRRMMSGKWYLRRERFSQLKPSYLSLSFLQTYVLPFVISPASMLPPVIT